MFSNDDGDDAEGKLKSCAAKQWIIRGSNWFVRSSSSSRLSSPQLGRNNSALIGTKVSCEEDDFWHFDGKSLIAF